MTGGYRKIKLFSLMVALIVAGLAVVGGTWAWGVNYSEQEKGFQRKIDDDQDTLNYNVSFLYHDGKNYEPSLLDGNVFNGINWCPGRTQIVYLKIENNEAFSVGVSIDMIVDENTFDGDMEYAVLYGQDLKAVGAEHPSSWENFAAKVAAQNVELDSTVAKSGVMKKNESYRLLYRQQLSQNLGQATESGTIGDETIPAGSDTYYLALAIHMDESTTVQGSADVRFNIQVDADTQVTPKASSAQDKQ